MKKLSSIIKIFLVLTIIFSQLGNATLVLAEEVTDNDKVTNLTGNDTNNEENDTNDEEESLEDEEDDLDDDNDNLEDEDNEKEEGPQLTKEDLETLMGIYINGGEIPEELKNLLIALGAPSVENEVLNEITLEDIMFVSELLKEESDIETEREENENLELVLGEIPEVVSVGDTFDVQVLVSNEVLEIISDNEVPTNNEEVINEDFIDGIEGLITTSDNLKVTEVVFEEFTSVNNEEGEFVGTGNEVSEDGTVLLTITFEALEEGEGEVTISGKVAKYLTISDFEDLTFTITINPVEEIPVGLETLNSSVGEFDKEFDSDVTEYTLTIPEGTTEITLSGSVINEEDETIGLSAYTIDSDNKTISIVVTRDENNKKVYTINIVRLVNTSTEEKEEVVEEPTETVVPEPIYYYVYSSNNYLKTLNIKDYEIDFDKSTLEYRLKVKDNVKFLDIMATPDDYRSRVEINGNGEFKTGENVVTIKVTAENGDTREYKLLVNKEAKKVNAEVVEENSSKTEKTIIIVLIIMVVIGLLYLIFKKDEEENNIMKK